MCDDEVAALVVDNGVCIFLLIKLISLLVYLSGEIRIDRKRKNCIFFCSIEWKFQFNSKKKREQSVAMRKREKKKKKN